MLLVHNQIKLITDMKEIKLKTLDLSHNLLVSVPQISSSLTQLNLRNNNISQVGAKEVVRSLVIEKIICNFNGNSMFEKEGPFYINYDYIWGAK